MPATSTLRSRRSLHIPESSNAHAVEATGIARRFGASWVLRGVTLRVSAGEVVALLGANGTGKSTLLRIIATLLRPHVGTVSVYGHDVVKDPASVRGMLGYMSHAAGIYDDLTARENLLFAAAMQGADAREVDGILERVGLLASANATTRTFSSGMQRRLAMGRLILSRPRLLLLDEPYNNLDASGVALLNEVIADRVRDGAAALVVVHELAPIQPVLERTLTLASGRVAA